MNVIECRNCIAACCGPNIEVKLRADERQFLADAGTIIEEVIPPVPMDVDLLSKPDDPSTLMLFSDSTHIETGYGIYTLRSKCGRVVNQNGFQACGAYEDPRRPGVCSKFTMGGKKCGVIRKARGVDR